MVFETTNRRRQAILAALTLGLVVVMGACNSSPSRGDTATDSFDTEIQVDTDFRAVPIPQNCDEADDFKTSVGCEFIAVDLSNPLLFENQDSNPQPPYAVVVANVHETDMATVEVSRLVDGDWEPLPSVDVAARGVEIIAFEDYEFAEDFVATTTGISNNGVYKLSTLNSDKPIIAYQFNPLDGASSYTTDASMLIPTSFLETEYSIPGWWHRVGETAQFSSYFAVVALKDGTELTVTPTFQPVSATSNPGLEQPFTVSLNEGETLYVHTLNGNEAVAGSLVQANNDHPVAVFSGHECANIPNGNCCCDMLEEQIPPVKALGRDFIAARFPVVKTENSGRTQQTVWQIVAGERNTTVQFVAHPDLKAYLPNGDEFKFKPHRLARVGDYLEIWVDGTAENPGDFFIHADRPVSVVQYMQSGNYVGFDTKSKYGDPAMTYLPPMQQFLSQYAVLVPASWELDYLVITRKKGATTLVDGVAIPDNIFVDSPGVPYEIGRYQISEGTEGDGFHIVESADKKDPMAVMVVGFDNADSYAFPGGMGTYPVNPG